MCVGSSGAAVQRSILYKLFEFQEPLNSSMRMSSPSTPAEDATAFRRRSSIWEYNQARFRLPGSHAAGEWDHWRSNSYCVRSWLPSGRSILPSESRCILLSTHLKGGSRSRIVTIIVARERHWSSEEGPQIHSKGGESKRCQKPEDRSSFCLCPIVRSTLSAQNETGHVHVAGPRERSANQMLRGASSLAIPA